MAKAPINMDGVVINYGWKRRLGRGYKLSWIYRERARPMRLCLMAIPCVQLYGYFSALIHLATNIHSRAFVFNLFVSITIFTRRAVDIKRDFIVIGKSRISL